MSSNLGKVFCSIINAQILAFLKEHDVLSKSQIGFLPDHRTSDHIYTLHTLIKKHVSGVGGKVYNIIKLMYSENKCSTRIRNKRTEFFTQGRGVQHSLKPIN